MDADISEVDIQALRELIDRAAIMETLNMYWHALDSRDFDLLDSVFAPEVQTSPSGPFITRAKVKEVVSGVEKYPVSHHGPRTVRITLDGDRAHANSFAMDFLLLDPPGREWPRHGSWPIHDDRPGPAVRFHGLRYVDDLERLPEGWRITRRVGPVALWRAEVGAVTVHPDHANLRSAEWPAEEFFGNFA
jgi:SnoaL-like domain